MLPPEVIQVLTLITTTLSYEIMVATVVAGLLFGAIYNHLLNIPKSYIYHKAIGGINFILFLFLFRLLLSLAGLATVTNPWGWLGIMLLWVIYCFFVWLGQIAADSIHKPD